MGGSYDTELRTEHTAVIYIGYLFDAWGHCLTDGLKKLWFLRTEEGKLMLDNGAKVAFITLYNNPLPTWQAELWRLAGFDCLEWLHVKYPTQFDEVVVPDNCFVAKPDETRLFDERFVEIVNDIKKHAAEKVGDSVKVARRIYLTRTKLKGHKDANEKEIEKLFRMLGYDIVSPEKISVARQIYMWSNCFDIATTEGSIAHSAMFMHKGSRIVILRKADYVNGYQQAANRLAGVRATYIMANHSSRTQKTMPWAGPFYLCVTPELRQWSGIDIRLWPVFLKPSYWLYCLRNIKCTT